VYLLVVSSMGCSVVVLFSGITGITGVTGVDSVDVVEVDVVVIGLWGCTVGFGVAMSSSVVVVDTD